MDSKVNYTVVGFFVVFLTVALVAIFFWMTAFRQHKTYETYAIYMQEDVNGLTVNSPVLFNGVKVGYVNSIQLDVQNPQFVVLNLKIEKGTPISTSTVATLQPQGITGIMYVSLKVETTNAPILKAREGEKYPVIPAKPSILMQLGEVVPRVAKNINDVTMNINDLLDTKNRKAMAAILANLEKFTKTLKDNSANLDASMNSTRKILKDINIATKSLPDTMKQLQATLNEIRHASGNVADVSRSIKYTMRDGQLALSNFSTQVMPATQQMMSHLAQMMANLQKLTLELTRNPSMLVRGKQPSPLGPGEKAR